MTDMMGKRIFRLGYESIILRLLETEASDPSFEMRKFRENYIIRDIYVFLMDFDESIMAEYEKAITTNDGEWDYAKSNLSSESVDCAVSRVFNGQPQFLHTYFLSKICHLLFFGIRRDLTRIAPCLLDSFTRVIDFHEAGYGWPYALELRDAFDSLHEFIRRRHWPPNMLARHFYICFAELYEITKNDLCMTVGADIDALEWCYLELVPLEYTKIKPKSPLNDVIFDDTYAYFAYLKVNYPNAIHPVGRENLLAHLRRRRTLVNSKKEYKALPNAEKLEYVGLADNLTRKEIDYVKIRIAPAFEVDSFMRAGRDRRFREALVQAHEERGRF